MKAYVRTTFLSNENGPFRAKAGNRIMSYLAKLLVNGSNTPDPGDFFYQVRQQEILRLPINLSIYSQDFLESFWFQFNP